MKPIHLSNQREQITVEIMGSIAVAVFPFDERRETVNGRGEVIKTRREDIETRCPDKIVCRFHNNMDSVPLIPKAKLPPSMDASPIIREFFQDEIESALRQGSSKRLSKTIMASLEYNEIEPDDLLNSTRTAESIQNLLRRRENLLSFSENVYRAYVEHEKETENVSRAEKNLFENHAHYLKREAIFLENKTFQELYVLKRQPHLKALDSKHVRKYKLLQGEAGLPPLYQVKSDFRVQNFGKWRKRLNSLSDDSVIMNHVNMEAQVDALQTKECIRVEDSGRTVDVPKIRKPRPKKEKLEKKEIEIFRAEPKIVFFTRYKPGEVYTADIEVKNIHTKGMLFQVKPMSSDGPFFVHMKTPMTAKKLYPGLSFQLGVEFTPKSLDVIAEDIYIAIEEGKKLLIPLVAYLEPPILKTHKDINEFTKLTVEKIASSCIECGACFTGDTKVTKLRFKCYRGSGEFFVMSSENWNRNYVNSVTNENFLEIPPFRVYPVYFKIDKNEAIDLFVEFSPKNSGTHVENIMIACDNGEVRSLDLLGDAISWHSYFFSFQDDLLKELPVDSDDDPRVKYYINFRDTTPTGKVQKCFAICNNSNMSFEYQWKIREVNVTNPRQKYLKLSKYQVKIEPDNGTLEPSGICDFKVFITFDNSEIGAYRMVLSLYVLNLPYQCIEEDNTIIQPTGLVRNLYSQSLCGEEEFTTPSPELMSLQGTYESLQESIKSYVEYQAKAQTYSRNDFCRTTCIPNPGLCAKPLKKSKTYFNIGDNIEDESFSCVCRGRPEETVSDSCTSNDKIIENVPKSEVVWDFVDILVDEIELWVDVQPVIVSVQPVFIDLATSVAVGQPPVSKTIRLINSSQSSTKCRWIKSDVTSNTTVTIICHHPHNNIDDISTGDAISERQFDSGRKSCNARKSDEHEDVVLDLPGLSEITCSVEIFARRPGEFSEKIVFFVDGGDPELTVLVQGKAVGKFISVIPDLIDFEVVKQGTRISHPYTIVNQYPESVSLTAKVYDFDFDEETFDIVEGITEFKEERLEEMSSISKNLYFDARYPGLKSCILQIQPSRSDGALLPREYILSIGDIKIPDLNLISARLGLPILAPTGMMYVGKTITKQVILKNGSNMKTVFTWGHPFGCHSRKIKVVIRPESGKINEREKLRLEIVLTPLDEGIVDHFYIPCFFCRKSEPLLLSIVGIISKVNVTFEILEPSSDVNRGKVGGSRPGGTALRISWPTKQYDPNLGETYRKQIEVLQMQCRCFEVQEEVNRVFGPPASRLESGTDSSSTDSGGPQRDRQKVNVEKSKDFPPVKPDKCSSDENMSQSFFGETSEKKYAAENSVQKYEWRECFADKLQLLKRELEFLGVSYGTPVTRQFVIRNETPIETKFHICMKNFGKAETAPKNPIVAIKEKVLACSRPPQGDREANRQPLVLEINPSEGILTGLDAVIISVKASGNAWGEYKDVITCQIAGIQPFNLNVFVQIVGHPFYFPMFENYPTIKPVLRFQSVSQVSQPAVKKIRVVNRSSLPITITWLIFLTQPLSKDEEHEDSFNLCIESNANWDSNHSEGSTKSVKVYLPKNISESASTFRNMLEMRDFSQNSGTFESFGKGDTMSEKNEQDLCEGAGKNNSDCLPQQSPEEARSESQQFMFRIDIHNFQVDPKEIFFEPFEEKKITVTFDPRFCKIKNRSQEFRAVLTGCVKLKPADEECPGLYFRPTGMNFLSEIMDFNAVVETPVVSFEIPKGDLRFYVDANDVIQSNSKKVTIWRKFFLKNENQKSVPLKIEISPGSIFRVNKIETLDELHQKYNPETSKVNIEAGDFLELELECCVSYNGVIYAYEQLKLNRKKVSYSDGLKTSNATKSTDDDSAIDRKEGRKRGDPEPWCQYFNPPMGLGAPTTGGNSSVEPRDSFKINLNRMSSKSDSSICYDYSGRGHYGEMEGEYLGIPSVEESPRKNRVLQHVIVVEEEINFIQTGLITQTITAELHLSFPVIRIKPKALDMGNVYIGETSVRYCSLINLTGSPTAFKVKSKCNVNEFTAVPQTGNLPSANYNMDIGRTLTVEFAPKKPGYFSETFQIYCNLAMEFDCFEISVSGVATWNEKYKKVKFETGTRLQGIYPDTQKQ